MERVLLLAQRFAFLNAKKKLEHHKLVDCVEKSLMTFIKFLMTFIKFRVAPLRLKQKCHARQEDRGVCGMGMHAW